MSCKFERAVGNQHACCDGRRRLEVAAGHARCPRFFAEGGRIGDERARGPGGEGFPVRRAFAGVALERLDPFVHMDQMGEVEYGPGEPKGTAWHPHGDSRP